MHSLTSGSITVGRTSYPWHFHHHVRGGTYYRTRYRDHTGKQREISTLSNEPHSPDLPAFKTFTAKVKKKHQELQQGEITLHTLSPERKRILITINDALPTLTDLEKFLEWKTQQTSSIKLGDLISLYIKDKSRSAKALHLRGITNFLHNSLLDHFTPDTVFSTITYPLLNTWYEDRYGHLSDTSRKNARTKLTGLWNFARQKSLWKGDTLTPADRISFVKITDRAEAIVFTPEQGRTLLNNCPTHFLPWLILCGWNGLRSSEVMPYNNRTTDILQWEDINWEEKTIHVSKAISKTVDRVIDLSPLAIKLLKPLAKTTGPLITKLGDASYYNGLRITEHLGTFLENGWSSNALRKSSVSYSCALIGISRTALSHGNSEGTIRQHYLRGVSKKSANHWNTLHLSDSSAD